MLVSELACRFSELEENGKKCLLQKLINSCLFFLGNIDDDSLKMSNCKLCDILTQLLMGINQQEHLHQLLKQISDHLLNLVKVFNNMYKESGNIFIKKMNVLEFNEIKSHFTGNIENLLVKEKLVTKSMGNLKFGDSTQDFCETFFQDNYTQNQELWHAISGLVKCVYDFMSLKLKSSFKWELNRLNEKTIVGVHDQNVHNIIVELYVTCKIVIICSEKTRFNVSLIDFQKLTKVLEPYIQKHATTEASTLLKDELVKQSENKQGIIYQLVILSCFIFIHN